MTVQSLGKQFRNEDEAISALQAEIDRLEERQQLDQDKVRSILESTGHSSVDDLIKALAGFASPALRRKVGATKKKTATRKKRAAKKASSKKTTKKAAGKRASKKVASKKAVKKRGRRTALTDAKVAEMKDAFGAKMPGKEIAKKFGVSYSTVQNVKKRLGLTGK